jgi:hypothetical protein
MSALAARALAGFARVMRAAGKERTYRRMGAPGAYDPTTGGLTAPTATTLRVRCVLTTQVQQQTSEGQDRFTRVALLPSTIGSHPPQSLAPNDGDEIDDNGRVYTVADLAPHEIAGTVVGWRALLRAGR